MTAFPRLRTRTRVVYNGLDLPARPFARPFEDSPVLRLVLVGRLSSRKGQDVAIGALAGLRAGGTQAQLTLVGDHYPGYEGYVEDLHALAAQLGVIRAVNFAGFHRDLHRFWADADIALVPSRLEPFGNVAVEAMAAGVPVIASAVQGLAEVVQDGVTGRLVPAEDVAALVAGLIELNNERDKTREMAAAATRSVMERFSLDRYSAEMVEVVVSTRH